MKTHRMMTGFLLLCISLLGVAQQPTPANTFDGVIEKAFYSDILDEQRLLYIHIPTRKANCPVLYLLDAQSLELYREALACTQTNEGVGSHIIVGIVTSGTRNRDMIPVQVPDRPGSGGAGQFLAFLTKEVIPYVDMKFNTDGNNILHGGSNAGLFAMFVLLQFPEPFLGFIASSPMIGHCNDYMMQTAEQMDPGRLDGKYLFIHYGLHGGEYSRAKDYIPGYYELVEERFGQFLHAGIRAEKSGGHVPVGGIANGLEFIHGQLRNQDTD